MLEIYKIFICDDISLAKFGKVNLIGLNPGPTLTLEVIPYNLTANIVIEGRTDERIANLALRILMKDGKNNTLLDNSLNLPEQELTDEGIKPLFLVQPVHLLISSYGILTLSLYRNKKELYKHTYQITKGDSPLLKNPQQLSQSNLFSGYSSTDLNFVIDLLGQATFSLKIVDSYVDPPSLLVLLQKVNSKTDIEILTLEKNRKNFIQNASFKSKFINATVKFSRRHHDRFVNINNTEYYHFGHSLKDIVNGRISRCSKIINIEEIKDFERLYTEAWSEATS